MPDDAKELDALLERLEEEENELSARRRKLHDRIALFPDPARQAELQAQEEELSQRRRELHRRIDEVRAQRNELRHDERERVD
jgi:chromosome segregation ATPase